jgi:asparagine synthase (glutamine-hydrolysing)
MCGIAGILGLPGSNPDPNILDKLQAALAHRGPDGVGRHVAGANGLVQTRLSIIDLAGGRQPILDGAGRAIAANGEVYNYRELKTELPGATFATGSDCEPPLHLYARDGEGFTASLRGMYAIAIDDPPGGRAVLARDPFGIKPLYLAQGPWGVAFASEAQALVAAGLVAPAADPQAVAELLNLQFTCGAATIFPGIRRLSPGERMVVQDGRIVDSRTQPALTAGPAPAGTEDDLIAALDRVLERSVDLHQRSDVPYGMFLSGGIDSSALLALMARLNPQPVLAFTAGFPGTAAHDERDHARALATAVGAHHVEVAFTEADFWLLLPRVAAAMDDPAADYACLPTFKLAQQARAHVKVILAGEGGDELFGGYGRYRGAMRPWPFTRRMRAKGAFDGLGVLRPAFGNWRDRFATAERAAAQAGGTRLQQAQRLDCADWLPNDLLIKADRCLMANGIEGRVPFLDAEVASFAFSLPDRFKVRDGQGKWLLRRWLEQTLPAAQPFAPKKGFTVPVGEWMAGNPHLGEALARCPAVQAVAIPGTVASLFARPSSKTAFARWNLLFYALWHRRHVHGKAPLDDVMACLEDA